VTRHLTVGSRSHWKAWAERMRIRRALQFRCGRCVVPRASHPIPYTLTARGWEASSEGQAAERDREGRP